MIRPRLFLPILLTGLALGVGQAAAQNTAPNTAQNTVIQIENVRYDYAQVLRVTPVYQTLTAMRTEERCEPVPEDRDGSRLSRAVDALKGALRRDEPTVTCRVVQVEREFRRPIAYDVDYIYKGARFRSRLPEDPGNRLRIRIAITPAMPGARAP